MLIEEILRSCANERVAQAAVASIGRSFAAKVSDTASTYGLSVGGYAALSVERFARNGDEGEFRSVLAAMKASQEPVLAGLHRILCITIASGVPATEPRTRHHHRPRAPVQLCAMDFENRREAYV